MYLPLLLAVIATVITNTFICKAAKCEGSVTFYWTEKGSDRIERMRNYGLLEEKLEEEKYKRLKKYFKPENVYAYTMEGDCCWEIYEKPFFRGTTHKLRKGFSGIPDFPKFNVNSMKQVDC